MEERFVDVGGIELSIAEAGAGGKPFLLLHGFTGSKEDFTEWLDPLAREGWHAVAPDHRGHGSSAKPESDDAYSLAILAGDAVGLADALGFERFALLGHSMGGFVAQRVAIAAPGRLHSLVLMDTGHGPVDLNLEQVAAGIELVRTSGMDVLADLYLNMDSPLATPAHRRVQAERPGYAEFNDRKTRLTSPHLFVALAQELAGEPAPSSSGDPVDADRLVDTLPDLRALNPVPPTLVMVGEQDQPFLKPSREMTDAIAGAQLAVIPDAGHSPQFENPTAWWEVLTAFLRRAGAD